MTKVEDATIIVNSEILTAGQLEEKRQKVKKWQDYGYCKMAIAHFLEEEVASLTLTFEEGQYIMNLG